ncbi:hypothetical protein SmJEL517_g04828 [Synchytrium microbalum]|uniref:Dolichol-phosphate mannosyltransferase subunit 3 n=1 Tax=Synchytrium microbalum TaxID=1806994 RepID=A0A507BSF3_9FUNG|nr:uncharacterized protein SmJEL517_g04828 [Synchytrium microbalum]TPX32007.1 hypothetical protein SmJEL517_g04828 [Synchytrium microbalum]
MSRATSFAAQFGIIALVYLATLFHTQLVPSLSLPAWIDQIAPLPWWCLVTFGSYSLGSIGFALVSFPDAPKSAFDSLMTEIDMARAELSKKGVDVS